MPGLPPSALAVLDTAADRFDKPLKAAKTKSLTAVAVRRSMHQAARAASPGQSPAVLYAPSHADALVVLHAEDLAALLKAASGRSDTQDRG